MTAQQQQNGASFEMSLRAAAADHALPPAVDMISATSRLQIEAAEVRSARPNWSSYLRSNLVPQEEYNFIVAFEEAKNKAERDAVLNRDRQATARCLIALITDVAKEQLIRYVLTVLDDLLQVFFLNFFTSLAKWLNPLKIAKIEKIVVFLINYPNTKKNRLNDKYIRYILQ